MPKNPLAAAIDAGLVSVQEIVDSTGFSRSKVQDNAKGRRVPTKPDRAAYAEAIGVSPSDFEKAWFGDVTRLLNGQDTDVLAVQRILEKLNKEVAIANAELNEAFGALDPSTLSQSERRDVIAKLNAISRMALTYAEMLKRFTDA